MTPATDLQAVTCLIGIGSNLDPAKHVMEAVRALRKTFPGVRVSTFYWTRPLEGREQPPYINGVACITTKDTPVALRRVLLQIETACGRRRDTKDHFASRTLDLDLLTFGDQVLPELEIPSPDLLERDFVLLPAAQLLPGWRHPILGQNLGELAERLFPECPNIVTEVNLDFIEGV